MVENFDCTQFITFCFDKPLGELKHCFDELRLGGFTVIKNDEIRLAKREYFKEYISQHFIELKQDGFLGEIDEWREKSNPPGVVFNFLKIIRQISEIDGISELKLILTSFAEMGTTSNIELTIEKKDIEECIFNVTRFDYDKKMDNLVLRM